MAKKPNYTARQAGALGVIGGLSGAAGATVNPAARLAAAGLDSGAADIAGHIAGSGMIGLVGAAGGYLAYKGIKAATRHLGRQWNK
jgi:hypothetical protein